MAVVMDTRVIPKDERISYWVEASRAQYNPLHLDPDPGFVAQMRGDMLGPLGVFRIVSSPSTMTRTHADVVDGDPECVQLSLVRAGALRLTQYGRSAVIGPGAMTSYDTSAPAIVRSPIPFEILAIRIPRLLLGASANHLPALTAVTIPAGRGWPRLAAGLFNDLADGLTRGWFGAGDEGLVDVAIDVTRHMYDELGGGALRHRGARTALLPRARSFIDANLHDPGLGPQDVARACHASVRAVHYAFAGSGETVAGWIRARRIERAAQDLDNRVLDDEPLSEIARRWGFASPSLLSRQFRAAHGCTPRAYREASVARDRGLDGPTLD
jgi:AraC-like DNA-binding protein